MESLTIAGFAPEWAVAPIRAQAYHVSDLPNERNAKIEKHNPELPKLSHPPIITPAIRPVDYAEQLGKLARSEARQQIANNMAQARNHAHAHYGSLHLVA
jgi:hypothetical protein